jgi:signal peptidase II
MHTLTVQLLLPATLLVLLDQLSKALTLRLLPIGHSWPSHAPIRLEPVVSSGALGTSTRARWLLLLLLALAAISAAILLWDGRFLASPARQLGLAFAFGGAASNLIDRFRLRAVVDMFHLGAWPAFNLADVAIVLGLVTALLVPT